MTYEEWRTMKTVGKTEEELLRRAFEILQKYNDLDTGLSQYLDYAPDKLSLEIRNFINWGIIK